jgi:hypothetical protein
VATAAVVVAQVLPFTNDVVTLVTLVALVVVFGALGVEVLRMTDAEWDGVPRAVPSPEPVRA